jgi:hypothetical protein
MKRLASMVVMLSAVALAPLVHAQLPPPLPEGLTVSSPPEGTAPERAKYLGAWTGQLDRDGLAVTYVVTAIEGDTAQVVYAHGTFAPWGISTAGSIKLVGTFNKDGSILSKLRNGAHLTGRLLANGNLELSWLLGGNYVGELKPLTLPSGGGK